MVIQFVNVPPNQRCVTKNELHCKADASTTLLKGRRVQRNRTN